MYAEQNDWLVCHECGELQTTVSISPEYQPTCHNCGVPLHIGSGEWIEKACALAVTGLILFIISNVFPLLALEVGGFRQEATLMSGVFALLERDQWLLSALVFTTIFLFPLLELLALMYLLLPYRAQRKLPGQIPILRWLILSRPWSMLEIFLLGVLVTSVKLKDMAILIPGPAMYSFFALVMVLILIYITIDRRKLWGWLYPNNCYTSDGDEALYDCKICEAVVGESIVDKQKQCPRCTSDLHKRIPHSLEKTSALLLAALILYLPANLLPMMTYNSLGEQHRDTIFSGVVKLIADGMWGIAIVVFVASIVVPIAKFVVLIYLIWSAKKGFTSGAKQKATLYRITEFIGRWSMVDVFVVTLLVALVQFGFIGNVEPGGAIIAFGAVVVLTMLAAETFDPRLLWDAQKNHDN